MTSQKKNFVNSSFFLMEKSGRRPLNFAARFFVEGFEIKNVSTQRGQGTGRVPKFGSFLIFDVFIRWYFCAMGCHETDLHKLPTKAKDQFVFFFGRACSLAKFEETCSLTFLKHSSHWKLCRGIISMPTHFRYQPLQRHWANGQLERSSSLCRSPLEEYIPRVPFFSSPLLSLYWRSTQGQRSWLLNCESQDQFVIYQREQVLIHSLAWKARPGWCWSPQTGTLDLWLSNKNHRLIRDIRRRKVDGTICFVVFFGNIPRHRPPPRPGPSGRQIFEEAIRTLLGHVAWFSPCK